MKFLRNTFSIAMVLIATASMYGQDVFNDKMKATKTERFEIKNNKKTISFVVKVYENREYEYKKDKSDKGKVNQDRIVKPAMVTKLIYVDSDTDDFYDRYIVLRYKKTPEDSFELIPTKKGFAVVVDKKHVEHIVGEGTYIVDNKDRDFFVIDEFYAI